MFIKLHLNRFKCSSQFLVCITNLHCKEASLVPMRCRICFLLVVIKLLGHLSISLSIQLNLGEMWDQKSDCNQSCVYE